MHVREGTEGANVPALWELLILSNNRSSRSKVEQWGRREPGRHRPAVPIEAQVSHLTFLRLSFPSEIGGLGCVILEGPLGPQVIG